MVGMVVSKTLLLISFLDSQFCHIGVGSPIASHPHSDNPSCQMSPPYLSNKDSVKAVTHNGIVVSKTLLSISLLDFHCYSHFWHIVNISDLRKNHLAEQKC